MLSHGRKDLKFLSPPHTDAKTHTADNRAEQILKVRSMRNKTSEMPHDFLNDKQGDKKFRHADNL